MKISAPSFIIPATRAENALYLKDLVDEIELLFFDSSHDFDMPQDDEITALKKINIKYSAHLPTDTDLSTEAGWSIIDSYITKLEPLNISRFVIHPSESAFFFNQMDKRRSKNIIIENTDFYGSFFDDAVSAGFRLCMDNAHCGDGAQSFLERYSPHIDEFHLQGIKDGHHHKSLEYLEPTLLKSVFSSATKNNSTVCLEVFNKVDFLKSYEIFKGLS